MHKSDPVMANIIDSLVMAKNLNAKNTYNIDPREFSTENGLLIRNNCVVIPKPLRGKILKELHEGHFGIVRMKGLARSCCWWQDIDSDIERLANSCENCLLNQNNPNKVAKHIWEPVTAPFKRVHVDYAGLFLGYYYFILVDAYSKWPEIFVTTSVTAKNFINICREIFARFGLPRTLASDNGPAFISEDLTEFLKVNGISQKFLAPYHPATNVQAERYVQMIKAALRKMNDPKKVKGDVQTILFQYRNMPHPYTSVTPAELFLGRRVRCRLDLLKPNIKMTHGESNAHLSVKSFQVGQGVIVRNYDKKAKWFFGKVQKILGKLHYEIELDDGRIWKRHFDQIRKADVKRNVD